MTQSNNPYNWIGDDGVVSVFSTNVIESRLPDSDQTGLLAGYWVERGSIDKTRMQLAGAASTSWIGCLKDDQLELADGSYSTNQAMAIVTEGVVNTISGDSINDDTPVKLDAAGRVVTWTEGIDSIDDRVGKTLSECTAADETVLVKISRV